MISHSHKYSPKQEKQFCKKYGAKPVSNSGRGAKKGDSILSVGDLQFMVDNKATDKKSYSITEKVLNKVIEDALQQNKLPLLHIEIMCNTPGSEEFFVIPKQTFDEILEELYRLEELLK